MKRIIQEISARTQHWWSRIEATAVIIPAVFVVATLAANTNLKQHIAPSVVVAAATLGGPATAETHAGGADEGLIAATKISTGAQASEDEELGAFIVSDASILSSANPERGALTARDGVVLYKIQKGETLSSVAAKFGVSLNTVQWANKSAAQKTLRVGQEITVLPISGIFHEVQPDETLGSIAARYDASESRIAKYNKGIRTRELAVGENIIIPDARPSPDIRRSNSILPEYPGYYTLPTTGWNWGKLHNHNAVDIANSCGTPIYASAEGLVVTIGSPDEWNEGYGGFVMIEHPNSTKTRYAHNERNAVTVGNYILQGDTIGYIGNSGLTHGPTGCHLHFEVHGAKNPFAK